MERKKIILLRLHFNKLILHIGKLIVKDEMKAIFCESFIIIPYHQFVHDHVTDKKLDLLLKVNLVFYGK